MASKSDLPIWPPPDIANDLHAPPLASQLHDDVGRHHLGRCGMAIY
jgi:hypothetical protein